MSLVVEPMPSWVRWLTAYQRAWNVELLKRLTRIETAPAVQPRVFRNASDAARYCGFAKAEHFLTWAARVGFEIPKTKLVKQRRHAFLIEDLDAAILRDPAVCRNRRHR